MGNEPFEKCLDKLRYNNKRHRTGSMAENGVLYYDANHQLQNERTFLRKLENMSQPELVREINFQELMKRVEELEKLIVQDNNIVEGNADKSDTKEVEKEKKILSEQFDEAFHISPAAKTNEQNLF